MLLKYNNKPNTQMHTNIYIQTQAEVTHTHTHECNDTYTLKHRLKPAYHTNRQTGTRTHTYTDENTNIYTHENMCIETFQFGFFV